MNAIGAVTFGLTTQKGAGIYDSFQTKNLSKTQERTDTNSFLSILKRMDINADDSLDTNELKSGLEGFISNFIFERDLDKDQALNAKEAGISTGAISHLDANSDQVVDGGEILSEAGRILDGLVSILDINSDKRLSKEELAIFELLFSSRPSAAGKPDSDINSIFDRNPSSAGENLELDMDTIPDRMREAGFQGSDNALYYALAHVYNFGPDREMPDDGAGSLATLNTQRDAIYKWFDGEIDKLRDILEENPEATVTVITNDGRDRCGFRLGPAIMERLKEFGDRVQLGTVFPESAY